MASDTNNCKIWIKFESKRQDGSIIKLRVQDLGPNRMEDFMNFYTTHFIRDEAFHKAAGIYKSANAIEEYKKVSSRMYELNPPHIAICCLDDDSEETNQILAVSTVQLMSPNISVDDFLNKMGIDFETQEIKAIINILMVMAPKFPESIKKKYECFHEGRGIIVHPDYRGLGIASQIVKQRRLLMREYNIPMTEAWMTSGGSQKAAERDGWETVAEISPQELDDLTGLNFEKNVPTYKLMIATLESH